MSEHSFSCDCNVIHSDTVTSAVQNMPGDEIFSKLIAFYKLIGDGTRCKILFLLDHRQMCVCDIAYALGISKSLVSHQLRLLRESNIVKSRREGKEVFYTLCDDHITEIFEAGLAHVSEEVSEL